MNSLIAPFWNICRFRLGPQDLPCSTALLRGALLFYVLISTVVSGFDLEPASAVMAALVDAGLMLSMIWLVLWARQLTPRFMQSAAALLGTGILFGFVAVPLMWWQSQYTEPNQALAPSLLILMLFGWNVAVIGHILRHALNTQFYIGVLMSLLYTYISITIIRAFFVASS